MREAHTVGVDHFNLYPFDDRLFGGNRTVNYGDAL